MKEAKIQVKKIFNTLEAMIIQIQKETDKKKTLDKIMVKTFI